MAVPDHQVFISFRGADVRNKFLSFVEDGLERACIKYYVDAKETRGRFLDILFQRIQESQLVLIIFSQNFMKSRWCVKELLATMNLIGQTLWVIPIFYNVKVREVEDTWNVAKLKHGEEIGEEMDKQVKKALMTLTELMAIKITEYQKECDGVKLIVNEVKKVLTSMVQASVNTSEVYEGNKQDMSFMTMTNLVREGRELKITQKVNFLGITQRLQKLQEKLGMDREISKETRIIGVLGMPGIGKTTLAKKLFEEGKHKFHRKMFFEDIHKTAKEKGLTGLRVTLLQKLLKKTNMPIKEETTHESENVEAALLDGNVFLVLDNLSDKKQLEYLLGNRKWINKGSKIVIVTSDKSLVEGLVDDTYIVPGLNEREALECFGHYACGDHYVHEGILMKLSREFVDHARGNPLALKVLGGELRGRTEDHWKLKLLQLAESPNKTIEVMLNVSYDGLSQQQKEAFLDVTCFFKSENHKFVRALVDSESEKGISEIKDLADKFLINISGGRVDMHSLLYTLGKKLASQTQQRLWNHDQDIIRVLKKKPGKIKINDIRGIFLDMSKVGSDIPLSKEAFDGMDSLRYLKIYDSRHAGYKLNFSNGLKLALQEIRYLHWLKFPEEELPQYFNPKNLTDLQLPYSKIKRLWDGVKDTSNLTWVDLNHSVDLYDLAGLVGAQNLQRLNLEGCTELRELHAGMQSLKSLVSLNLRGCTSLVSLVEMNMESLKTLILSDCSNLEDFQVISEQLEALFLDGTALKGLPPSIIKLQKLVLLNLKDCTMLATVPDCLGNMKALQEVILSGCLKLKSYPDLQENMRRLRVFLLDGTSIKEVPKLLQNPDLSEWTHRGVKGFPLLSHLCLRGNNKIQSLQPHIGDLYHLKSIDLKYCKNLECVPTLPPNLQRLNAHGCESLKKVGNPLAHLALTDQIHSTFIFANCHKLDEVAKTGIISYIQKKSQLMSNALDRYNLGSVVESSAGASFPGCEVPAWLSHQAYGSVIVLPLSRHWSNNGTIGVALCATVSCTDYQEQNHRFLVKCTCEFKNPDGSLRQFSCTVGGNEPEKIESDHVFIGYTCWLQTEKQKKEGDDHYQASLRFEVTDGSGEVVKNCQVLKCGFSFVKEYDETESVSWEVNSDPNDPRMDDNNIHGISMSPAECGHIITRESSRTEEIDQQGEASCTGDSHIDGISMLFEDSEESKISVSDESPRMKEMNQQGEANISGMLLEDSDKSKVFASERSPRKEEIIKHGETSTTGDHNTNGALISSADSVMEETDQQKRTSIWTNDRPTNKDKHLNFFCLSCFNPRKEMKPLS